MATMLLGNSPPFIDLTSTRRHLRRRVLPPDCAASTSHAFHDAREIGIMSSHFFRRRRLVFGASVGKYGGEDPEEGDVDEASLKEWESEMKTKFRELEDMKELEKRAAELQIGLESESEDQKRERVRKGLEKLAKEQAERRETAKLMFELGQKAYGKGMYKRAIEFLEGALTIIPRPTLLGGEVQIWLAMAYDANNRHGDCIDLYRQLEKQHPIISIRRQAAKLRYILEAPKLKISKDEMVTIPLIGSSYDNYAGTWTDKYKDQERRKLAGNARSSPSQDFWGDFLPWQSPSGLEKSRIIWVLVTLWLAMAGLALLVQR